MKVSGLTDIAQLVATIGVNIELGLVGYEIRGNNAIVFQQAVSTNWVTWTDLEMAQIQSGFSEAFTKSITNAEDLTLREQVILNAWLSAIMSAWEHDYVSISLANGSASGVHDELAANVPFYFGNAFTRMVRQEQELADPGTRGDYRRNTNFDSTGVRPRVF